VHLFTFGIFSKQHREFLYQLCRFYNWRQNGVVPVLPYEDSVVKRDNPVRTQILEPDFEFGNVTLTELSALIRLTSAAIPSSFFEIGTFDGRTTLNLAANSPLAKIWTLDLPSKQISETKYAIASGEECFVKKPSSGQRFVETPFEQQITQLYGDSATFEFTRFENSMDVVFVDGSHAYEYVVSDTINALKILKPGGMIIWHDYDNEAWPGVTKHLNELYQNDPRFSAILRIHNTTLAYLQTRK